MSYAGMDPSGGDGPFCRGLFDSWKRLHYDSI